MIEKMAQISGKGMPGIYEVEKDYSAMGSPYTVFLTVNKWTGHSIIAERRVVSRHKTFRSAMNCIVTRYESPTS